MEMELQRSISSRANRRGDRNNQHSQSKDVEGSFFSPGRFSPDYPMKIVWKTGFIRLVLVGGILWMLLILTALLFHIWSCQSSLAFFSAICNRESKVYFMLDTMGLVPKAPHRCPIPVTLDPNKVVIPKRRTPDETVLNLSYIMEDELVNNGSQSSPLFGGHQTWSQREESFKLKPTMEVHCGFMRNGGAEMAPRDIKYVKKCKYVVASGIFDAYDTPNQPSNISLRSQKLFCFLMVVDEISLDFIKKNVTVTEDNDGGQWVGIWRLVLLKHPPYDEPRRNGKVPKILTHRLFPRAQYSIWIDGKMELIVDPLLILERYLWRGKHTFAIAQHKHHRSIYEEADAIKRRKRYARPLIDLHMKIYRYEGMESWSPMKKTISDVPEGAIIIREHTALNNLFSCLWFNEVNLFTPRDQLSFGYVVYRLGGLFKFFMFPNCEYNSLFVLHPHIREHSSKIEWVKTMDEFKKNKNGVLKEGRGGLGLWMPYPGNLDLVVLPPVARTSQAG
ncbi:probable hexosyltransferase MUCI70 [Malania oleifera]|uniref:probable hexosyltransferase MUCI70 n=1 Tax=Malania oleifera TaxID=397392 RepID=UPI0025ADBDF1|nr:probable hexosyltransferase MUCI70 [Malania oleifera]XP_057966413.1 probable hexosyltransferase MUCI70 [Malania oleifera]XP_057966414.1 probable hexosyltransferase MUCI70 [Malania oleifera]XP_057966416.1 probable hexosyltransferase MUCI70 [Malania oleifera]XP_057966417.1 probable hexosyltransferase MUCI70 [Malania oleifera]XP_057966418.1 probable hexosyltransferase MUCI70 [Malania oleifera]XP_057966419.1 probable hexosyltransferase MUCI70 [Malania oleifera]